jgi:hypothetical protein
MIGSTQGMFYEGETRFWRRAIAALFAQLVWRLENIFYLIALLLSVGGFILVSSGMTAPISTTEYIYC